MNIRTCLSTFGLVLLAGLVSAAEMTHADKGLIGQAGDTRAKSLSSFCLDRNDNLVICDQGGSCLRVISPEDKLLNKWALDFAPQVVACRADGTLAVAGSGRIALLDAAGTVLVSTNLPVPPLPAVRGKKPSQAEVASLIRKSSSANSIGCMGDDIFVCNRVHSGYTIHRMNSRLEDMTPIVKGLNGCCGQMDFAARNGSLYVAANCDSEVVRYDRDGKKFGSFGKDKDHNDSYFNGCCEPKNICVGPDGSLYVAESAQACINRFSVDGKLLDRVGVVKGLSGCVRVTVAVNRDASRVYMLDTEKNVIHVLVRNAKP